MGSINNSYLNSDIVAQMIRHFDATSLFAVEKVCRLFRSQSLEAIDVWKQIAENMGVADFVTPTYSYRAVVLDSFRFYCEEAMTIPAQEIQSLKKQGTPAQLHQMIKSELSKLPKEKIMEYQKQWCSLHADCAITPLLVFQINRVWKDVKAVGFPPEVFYENLTYDQMHLWVDAFFEAEKQLGEPLKNLIRILFIALRPAFLRAFESNQFYLPPKMCKWIQTLPANQFVQVLNIVNKENLQRCVNYREAPSCTSFLFKNQQDCDRGIEIIRNYLIFLRNNKMVPSDAFVPPKMGMPDLEKYIRAEHGLHYGIMYELNSNTAKRWKLCMDQMHTIMDSADHLYFTDITKAHDDESAISSAQLSRYGNLDSKSRLQYLWDTYPFNALNLVLDATNTGKDIEEHLVKALDPPSAALVLYFIKSQLVGALKRFRFKSEFEGQKFTLGSHFEHLVSKMSDIDYKILLTWLPFFSIDVLCAPQKGVPHSFVVFDPAGEVLQGKKYPADLIDELNHLLKTYLKSLREESYERSE